jgi:enamine deaminase RidA (YjgF/YER057c/UK114 family)
MFRDAGQMLRNQRSSFLHVLRTWCYLADIDRDYDQFNASRNRFFKSENMTRLPASTGIGAGLLPTGNRCGMDLYALLNPQRASIEVMHASTLNEAPEYGSSFSRGMKLVLPGKTVLFISGTASVDEEGATVHVGDARQQIERMLLNVRELLTPQGATFADVVQGISYLKCLDDFAVFREVLDQQDLSQMPNSIVVADVCRPELLCEIEMIAILPDDNAHVEPILRLGS